MSKFTACTVVFAVYSFWSEKTKHIIIIIIIITSETGNNIL